MAPPLREQSLFGHHQSRIVRPKHHRHAGKHARAQALGSVGGHAGTNRHGTAIRIEQGIQCHHASREVLSGQSVELNLDRLPHGHTGLVTLGQAKIDHQSGGVFQVDHRRTVLDVFTQVHAGDAHRARERCDDAHAGQARLGQIHLGLGHLQIGTALFKHPLRHEVLGHQLFVSLGIGLGNGELSSGLTQLGALQSVVELHQQLSLPHRTAVFEGDARDTTADLWAQGDALARQQGAHGLGFVLQTDRFHGGNLNRWRAAPATCTCTCTCTCTGARGAATRFGGRCYRLLKPPSHATSNQQSQYTPQPFFRVHRQSSLVN